MTAGVSDEDLIDVPLFHPPLACQQRGCKDGMKEGVGDV